jgi:integrase
VATSPDSFPVCSPDSGRPTAGSLDSPGALDAFAVSLGAAVDMFIAAKAAEGASERTLEWYRMITGRAVRRFGSDRPVDRIPAAELRVWLLELRETLAPESISGYVRGLKAFGNWCNAEELASAPGFRALRRPHVPHQLIAPFSTGELERLLALADPRERALTLLLLDTGLRLAEVTSLRVGDLRPDGTIRVLGKGSKERVVPLGTTARRGPPPLRRGPRSRRPGRPAVRRPLRRAAESAGHPVRDRAARPSGRRRNPFKPPHLPPHIRPWLPRQRRRRLQPPTDLGPRDARYGPPVRQPERGGSGLEAPGGITCRSPGKTRTCPVVPRGMAGAAIGTVTTAAPRIAME